MEDGALERTRTSDLQVRNLLLYPLSYERALESEFYQMKVGILSRMRRPLSFAALILLCAGCGVLSKTSVVGTWGVGGTAFTIPALESAKGTATFTEATVIYNLELTLKKDQGIVPMTMEGTYRIEGDTYVQTISKMTPDYNKLAPAVFDDVKAMMESRELKASLNKVGAAKIKKKSDAETVITFPDGKTIVLTSGAVSP